ncbi:MAG: hypothetical protein CMD54_01940 [Gammaproteobacteria bacterium]|nr:hypothetical protein [Gammaproteobacteria bacterium]HAN80685.1 hypothetical protein [Gammaproteobacteria bacterium]
MDRVSATVTWKDVKIIDSDVLIIEQSKVAGNGKKVLVKINGKGIILKTLRPDQDSEIICPAKRSMEPMS